MIKKLSFIIRITLTIALIYGVYTETGIWTALSLFLIFANTELQGKFFNEGYQQARTRYDSFLK